MNENTNVNTNYDTTINRKNNSNSNIISNANNNTNNNNQITLKKEKKILSLLRANGRIKLKEIAKKLHLQLDIVEKTVKESNNVIKHTTMLDFYKLGYQIRLFLALSVQSKQIEAIEDYLNRSPNVNSILKINNGYNFMCELYFNDLQESTKFIENLEGRFHIFHKDEYYILKSITEQKFMTNPNMV